MKCGYLNCKKKAVWLHTYYSSLSLCDEHMKRHSASVLRAIPSEKRIEASKENGKKGGRPKKVKPF